MSAAIAVRAALETAVNAMSPSLATAWENQAFTPPSATVPYQSVTILFARPSNAVMGSEYQELGYMQIKLMYPLQIGTATANARAELIRTTFAKAQSFTSGGIVTQISDTPEIQPGSVEDGRFAINVNVRFFANIL